MMGRKSKLDGRPTDRSLGPGERPQASRRYLHMLQEDAVVWTAFVQRRLIEFDEVWYDVHVGQPMALPEESPAYMKDVVDAVSRKRIDVVGRLGKAIYIIEVKPVANIMALGQVKTYRDLFELEFEVKGPVHGMIVAATSDVDILESAKDLSIEIIALEGVGL